MIDPNATRYHSEQSAESRSGSGLHDKRKSHSLSSEEEASLSGIAGSRLTLLSQSGASIDAETQAQLKKRRISPISTNSTLQGGPDKEKYPEREKQVRKPLITLDLSTARGYPRTTSVIGFQTTAGQAGSQSAGALRLRSDSEKTLPEGSRSKGKAKRKEYRRSRSESQIDRSALRKQISGKARLMRGRNDDLSLFSPRMIRQRDYYPLLEFQNLMFSIREFSFEAMQPVEKDSAKFNAKILKHLKQMMERRLEQLQSNQAENRFETSPFTLQKALEAHCREELFRLLEHDNKTAFSLSLTDSPRAKELVHIIQESGMLVRPLLHRLIFLHAQLTAFHKREGKYTPWSRELHWTLLQLIRPDDLGSGMQGKRLDSFLSILDPITAGKQGNKTQKVVNWALGDKKSSRKLLLDYLHSWEALKEESLTQFKEQVKSWSWDNLALMNIKTLQHEWRQHPQQAQRLETITLYEILRCLGNEDNGVTVIPQEIAINGYFVHRDGVNSYSSFAEFFNKLVGAIYKAGLSGGPISLASVRLDCEILLSTMVNRDEMFQKLFEQIYPLCLEKTVRFLKKKQTKDLQELPKKELRTMYLHSDLRELLSAIGMDRRERNAFYTQWLAPALAEDFKLLQAVPLPASAAQTFSTRLLRSLSSLLSGFYMEEDKLRTLLFDNIIPRLEQSFSEICGTAVKTDAPLHDRVADKIEALLQKLLGGKRRIPKEGLQALISEDLKLIKHHFQRDSLEEEILNALYRSSAKYATGASLPAILLSLGQNVSQVFCKEAARLLRHSGLPDEQAEGILHSFAKKITETCKECLEHQQQLYIGKQEALITKLLPFVTEAVAEGLKERGVPLDKTGSLYPNSFMALVPKNVILLLNALGMNAKQADEFMRNKMLPIVLKDIALLGTGCALPGRDTYVPRQSRLISVLRLTSNSCWFHANECIKKIYPKFAEHPFSTRYRPGTQLQIQVSNPFQFSVTYNRTLLVDKADKSAIGDYLAAIPFSWHVEPLGNIWKGRLRLNEEPEFIKYAYEVDKWGFYEVLLDWEEVEESEETAFSPRIVSSPRFSITGTPSASLDES